MEAQDLTIVTEESRPEISDGASRHQVRNLTSTVDLPDNPVVTIRPSNKLIALNLREVWAYRELLYFLTWRDIKVKYKQTALGAAWAVIQPVFTMLIFTLFFGRLAGVPSDGIPYPLFALAGLVPWTFFSNAITSTGNSLVGSANLITKVYFPRMIIPAAAAAAGLVDMAISLIVLILFMIYYKVAPTTTLIIFPVILFIFLLLALGVGMWLSALNVKYRDIRFAIPFIVQLWMVVSPIIYPATFLPKRFRWIIELNPLTGLIEGFRASVFGTAFPLRAFAISSVITILMLLYASYSFRRMETSFADIV